MCLNVVQPGPVDVDSISSWISQTAQNYDEEFDFKFDDEYDDNRNNGLEAIHIAARDGDTIAVRREIEENGVEVDFGDHVNGATALQWASRQVVWWYFVECNNIIAFSMQLFYILL